jgi:hypothetical protein
VIPSDGLWHGAVFSLEPDFILALGKGAGRAASGNPFLATSAQPVAYLVWVAVWLAGLLVMAGWSFGQRDL